MHPAALDPSEVIVASRCWRPPELIDVPLSSPQLPEILGRAVSIVTARTTPLTGDGKDPPAGSATNETDRTLTVQVLRRVTPEVTEILQPAVGSGSSRQLAARVRRLAEAATTLTGHRDDRLVAAVCVEINGTQGRLVAIAVAPGDRGRGWGRSLIVAMPSLLGVRDLTAETDAEAVSLYRALRFTVVSLGEKYPRVERFACSFRW